GVGPMLSGGANRINYQRRKQKMKVKKNRDPEQGEQQNTSTDAESLELQQCSDPDPEYLRQLAQLYQGESFSGKPIINKVVPHDSVGKALPDPIYTVEWEI